jgi:hypothetical protein
VLLSAHENDSSKERASTRSSQKMIPHKSQRQGFIDAAREAGASEDEAVFRENLKRITTKVKKKEEKTRSSER